MKLNDLIQGMNYEMELPRYFRPSDSGDIRMSLVCKVVTLIHQQASSNRLSRVVVVVSFSFLLSRGSASISVSL